MRILGICGSPRQQGNTEILLDKSLEGARKSGAAVEKLKLEELNIQPISEIEYENVDPRGLSPVKDDMHLIYSRIEECDCLILASPIFFGTVSGQMKTMIDRFQCVWISRYKLKKDIFSREKPGAFLCTAATNRTDFFKNARFIVKNFFHIIRIDYERDLFFPGIDPKGAVLERSEYLTSAFDLGHQLSRLIAHASGQP
jgi:multimeric flavodoxin WrbA